MDRPESNHRFANRMSMVEESSTARVFLAARQLKEQGVALVDLVAGEPDFSTPLNIKNAAKKAIDSDFTRYTPTAGVTRLREAIASRYSQDFGVELRPNEVVATVGAKQAIFNTLLALIDPGDEVIIPSPYWVTFPQVVALCGGVPVIVETSPENAFQVTSGMLERHVTKRTKAVILNSPNNPTGAVIPQDDFLGICDSFSRRGIYVVSDECYQRFVYDGAAPYTAAQAPENLRRFVVVCGSLSKTYCMTGWRLGYAIGHAALIEQLIRIQGHQTSNPTSISQAAAIEALTGPQEFIPDMIREFQRRRDFLIPALNRIRGIQCARPAGAFYAFLRIRELLGKSVKTADEFSERLLKDLHVAVMPGSGFGIEGFIRLSFAAAFGELEEAASRLSDFVTKL